MARYEYIRIPMNLIPDEVIKQYNLHKLDVSGWAYMEIRKGMPRLKQTSKLANKRLKKHFRKYGYTPCARTPTLWTTSPCPSLLHLSSMILV